MDPKLSHIARTYAFLCSKSKYTLQHKKLSSYFIYGSSKAGCPSAEAVCQKLFNKNLITIDNKIGNQSNIKSHDFKPCLPFGRSCFQNLSNKSLITIDSKNKKSNKTQ